MPEPSGSRSAPTAPRKPTPATSSPSEDEIPAIPGTAPLGKSLIAFIGAFVVVAGLGIALVEWYHRSGTTPPSPSATEATTHTADIPPPPVSTTVPTPTVTATETAVAADAAVIEIPEPTATATTTATAPTATTTATEAPTATVTATATATVTAPPTGGGSLTSQAQRALDRNQIQTAISLAKQATDANPGDAEAWLILGGAYEMVGNKTAARAAYRSCASSATGSRVSECKALLQ